MGIWYTIAITEDVSPVGGDKKKAEEECRLIMLPNRGSGNEAITAI